MTHEVEETVHLTLAAFPPLCMASASAFSEAAESLCYIALEFFRVRWAVAAVSDVHVAANSFAVLPQASDSTMDAHILREQAAVLNVHTEFSSDMEELSPPSPEVVGCLKAAKLPPEGDLKSLQNEFSQGFIRRLKAGEFDRLADDFREPDPSRPFTSASVAASHSPAFVRHEAEIAPARSVEASMDTAGLPPLSVFPCSQRPSYPASIRTSHFTLRILQRGIGLWG
jgi:hypothetical protein